MLRVGIALVGRLLLHRIGGVQFGQLLAVPLGRLRMRVLGVVGPFVVLRRRVGRRGSLVRLLVAAGRFFLVAGVRGVVMLRRSRRVVVRRRRMGVLFRWRRRRMGLLGATPPGSPFEKEGQLVEVSLHEAAQGHLEGQENGDGGERPLALLVKHDDYRTQDQPGEEGERKGVYWKMVEKTWRCTALALYLQKGPLKDATSGTNNQSIPTVTHNKIDNSQSNRQCGQTLTSRRGHGSCRNVS